MTESVAAYNSAFVLKDFKVTQFRFIFSLLLGLAMTLSAAQAADPAAPKPGQAKASGHSLSVGGMQFRVPAEWKQVQPENSLRFAQFEATSGADPVELVVFYFAPGKGGTQEDNINRWASQFTDAKGGPVKPEMRRTVINNMIVTRVELSGNYSRGVAVGVGANVKKDQSLHAAIVATPIQGNLTFHFFGPKAAVKQQLKRFETVLKSLHFTGH